MKKNKKVISCGLDPYKVGHNIDLSGNISKYVKSAKKCKR